MATTKAFSRIIEEEDNILLVVVNEVLIQTEAARLAIVEEEILLRTNSNHVPADMKTLHTLYRREIMQLPFKHDHKAR